MRSSYLVYGNTVSRTLILVLMQAVPFAFLVSVAWSEPHVDFGYFYYACHVVWDQLPWTQLYNTVSENHWLLLHHLQPRRDNQYLYPPQFAVLFGWLALLPFALAATLWKLLSILCFLWGSLLIRNLAGFNASRGRRWFFYTTVLLNLAFWWDFIIGNANWLIFFLISGALYLRYKKEKPLLAGVLVGLAVVIKLTPLFLLLYLVLRKEWKWLFGIVGTILTITLFTITVVGFQSVVYYSTHLTAMTETSLNIGGPPYNSSLLGLLLGWRKAHVLNWSGQHIHDVFIGYLLLTTVIVTGALFFSRNAEFAQNWRADGALGILLMLLFSPLLEGPHFLLGWISTWLLLGQWWDRRKTVANWLEGSATWLAFAAILTILSPAGWFLQRAFPLEYFFVLLLMLGLAVRMKFHKSGCNHLGHFMLHVEDSRNQ